MTMDHGNGNCVEQLDVDDDQDLIELRVVNIQSAYYAGLSVLFLTC